VAHLWLGPVGDGIERRRPDQHGRAAAVEAAAGIEAEPRGSVPHRAGDRDRQEERHLALVRRTVPLARGLGLGRRGRRADALVRRLARRSARPVVPLVRLHFGE
jgi:hypothetical protein